MMRRLAYHDEKTRDLLWQRRNMKFVTVERRFEVCHNGKTWDPLRRRRDMKSSTTKEDLKLVIAGRLEIYYSREGTRNPPWWREALKPATGENSRSVMVEKGYEIHYDREKIWSPSRQKDSRLAAMENGHEIRHDGKKIWSLPWQENPRPAISEKWHEIHHDI